MERKTAPGWRVPTGTPFVVWKPKRRSKLRPYKGELVLAFGGGVGFGVAILAQEV